MKKYIFFLIPLVCTLIFCCENENIEEKYYQIPEEDTNTVIIDTNTIIEDTLSIPEIVIPKGEIAWFPLNGNLNDSTENNIPITLLGDADYVDGLNTEYGKGLHLNGTSCLLITLGYYDTLSIVLWLKGDQEICGPNQPAIFDYGLNTISAHLTDATTGATMLNVKKNNDVASSEDVSIEYLNSFEKYSFLYFEAGGDLTRIYFKGYNASGEEIIYSEDLSFPGIIEPKSELLYIGRSSLRENLSESYFHGAIDEIHIFSHPLSDLEIESLAFTQTD